MRSRESSRIIIIGGGVSGLAAGCALARCGIDVTVIEANDQLGGCCTTTDLAGYTFHDGAVYVAIPRMLDIAFARLGIERTAVVSLRKATAMFSAHLSGGVTVTWREGRDIRLEGSAFDATRLDSELERLLSRWEPVLDVVTDHLITRPFSPWRALWQSWRHLPRLRGSVAGELRQLISDGRIRAALSGALLHTGVAPDDMPAASILALVGMLRDGLFIPVGGMSAIPTALATTLRLRGGRIRLASRVTRILVEHGRARGVLINGKEELDASAVISTINPIATFTTLVEPSSLPRSLVRRIGRSRLSHRAVSVQFGLATQPNAGALLNMVLPDMERQHEVVRQDPSHVRWPVYSMPTLTVPELAPRGGAIVEMFVPLAPAVTRVTWDDARRQEVAASAIAALRRLHEIDVAVMRLRTPWDFEKARCTFMKARSTVCRQRPRRTRSSIIDHQSRDCFSPGNRHIQATGSLLQSCPASLRLMPPWQIPVPRQGDALRARCIAPSTRFGGATACTLVSAFAHRTRCRERRASAPMHAGRMI